MTNRLTLRIVVPDPADVGAVVEVRPDVDGRDVLAVFPHGRGEEPETLLASLAARAEPHEARLAAAECIEACCGAVYVTIRREGDQVVWADGRNPVYEEQTLPEFRFDAAEYDRELDRARVDTGWEWPARTVARLLDRRLRYDPAALARWDCELHAVAAWPWRRDEVNVFLFSGHPRRQLHVTLPIVDGVPEDQADRLFDRLAGRDPRTMPGPAG